MNTLEHQILVVINRDHPLDSEDVRIHLDLSFDLVRSRTRIQEVLKVMTEKGLLSRVWKEPCDQHRGKWLYNLPAYAEPAKKLPNLSMDPIVKAMRAFHKAVKCKLSIGGCARRGRRP